MQKEIENIDNKLQLEFEKNNRRLVSIVKKVNRVLSKLGESNEASPERAVRINQN